MMPVYFNLQSHLWIVYLFFVNGLLIHGLCRNISRNYAAMTASLEASLLAAFFLSLSVNSSLLLLLDVVGESFSWMHIILPATSLGLLFLLVFKQGCPSLRSLSKIECNYSRLAIYVFVFVILFYNGALIEQLSDAWYHMSLANKIGLGSTFSPELGHLTGTNTRYYPPLWHANLALARSMSDISIPVFWNSVTAWAGVLKVMAFYLLAYSLSRKVDIASLSALLFVLLPGLGDSYLRVSAWPSHIAYTAMFAMFYVGFWVVDNYQVKSRGFAISVITSVIKQKQALITLFLIAILMLFVHPLELVWFYCGITAYLAALTICNLLSLQKFRDSNNSLLVLIAGSVFLLGLVVSIFGVINRWQRLTENPDQLMVFLLLPTLFLLLFFALWLSKSGWTGLIKNTIVTLTALLTLLLIISIDYRHALALIWIEIAYPLEWTHQAPHKVKGFFGGDLILPGWHLQLRSALLFSGLISIPISVWLAVTKPSRLSLFLCANALTVLLFCISPYLYQWLSAVMNYHSSWRIMTLLFHPIIIACVICSLWAKVKPVSQ